MDNRKKKDIGDRVRNDDRRKKNKCEEMVDQSPTRKGIMVGDHERGGMQTNPLRGKELPQVAEGVSRINGTKKKKGRRRRGGSEHRTSYRCERKKKERYYRCVGIQRGGEEGQNYLWKTNS